ncbi:MAG: hypothetical protein M1820_009452 [Bogoriella megaspora]|nr:MAG: hypothetical protein M1820_009452 [Bogoriella megaspora]
MSQPYHTGYSKERAYVPEYPSPPRQDHIQQQQQPFEAGLPSPSMLTPPPPPQRTASSGYPTASTLNPPLQPQRAVSSDLVPYHSQEVSVPYQPALSPAAAALDVPDSRRSSSYYSIRSHRSGQSGRSAAGFYDEPTHSNRHRDRRPRRKHSKRDDYDDLDKRPTWGDTLGVMWDSLFETLLEIRSLLLEAVATDIDESMG